jgi:hypothetical protein
MKFINYLFSYIKSLFGRLLGGYGASVGVINISKVLLTTLTNLSTSRVGLVFSFGLFSGIVLDQKGLFLLDISLFDIILDSILNWLLSTWLLTIFSVVFLSTPMIFILGGVIFLVFIFVFIYLFNFFNFNTSSSSSIPTVSGEIGGFVNISPDPSGGGKGPKKESFWSKYATTIKIVAGTVVAAGSYLVVAYIGGLWPFGDTPPPTSSINEIDAVMDIAVESTIAAVTAVVAVEVVQSVIDVNTSIIDSSVSFSFNMDIMLLDEDIEEFFNENYVVFTTLMGLGTIEGLTIKDFGKLNNEEEFLNIIRFLADDNPENLDHVLNLLKSLCIFHSDNSRQAELGVGFWKVCSFSVELVLGYEGQWDNLAYLSYCWDIFASIKEGSLYPVFFEYKEVVEAFNYLLNLKSIDGKKLDILNDFLH